MTTGNGMQEQGSTALPVPREAIVEQGLRIQQETAAERDALRREVSGLRSDIAGYKVMVEALQSQVSDADSRVQTMTLVRDEAVARRASVEAVLRSMLAIGRAFTIENEPMIRELGNAEDNRQAPAARVVPAYKPSDLG